LIGYIACMIDKGPYEPCWKPGTLNLWAFGGVRPALEIANLKGSAMTLLLSNHLSVTHPIRPLDIGNGGFLAYRRLGENSNACHMREQVILFETSNDVPLEIRIERVLV